MNDNIKLTNYKKGSIYLRDNPWFKSENVIKMGIATFIGDREGPYLTGEVERGQFIMVIEIPYEKMRIIDNLLKHYFKKYNIYKGGGTEFYDRCICNMVIPYIQLLNIEYRILTQEEINNMERSERLRKLRNYIKIKKLFGNIDIKNIIHKYKSKKGGKSQIQKDISFTLTIDNTIQPNSHQKEVLDKIEEFYKINDIGKLIWACGLGKALLSILIVKQLKFRNIVIGVYSINLQKQFKNELLKLFPEKSNILLIGGDYDREIRTANNVEAIKTFVDTNINDAPKFIITTYHSCHLLKSSDLTYCFKIGDEAHHLVGLDKDEEKGFRLFHKIKSNKTLFMTATEKTLETRLQKEIFSMEDKRIFGEYIDIKSINWAIENKKITDYNILVLKNTEDQVNDIIDSLRINVENKELFISCYMCLKSLEKYANLTHILLYTSCTEEADLSKKYIEELLLLNVIRIGFREIYNNSLHNSSDGNFEEEIEKFKNSNFGIISCVYKLGEGFDLPRLNGVCISCNMKSEIRIVQYILRPNRLESGNPNKIAYVIIPYIDTDDWENENKSYEKVRTIISQMRNVDDRIEQRIRINYITKPPKGVKTSEKEGNGYHDDCYFSESTDELNRIILRLRYSKALGSKLSEEQDEYNYVKSINYKLNIRSKREYNEKEGTHSNFIVNPEEYFKSKGVWTNWYDFIGVDTNKFIQSKQDWIDFCKDKKICSLANYYEFCELYDILPEEPADFYINFTNIPTELGFYRARRR